MYNVCYKSENYDVNATKKYFKCNRCLKDARFPHCDDMSNVNKICSFKNAIGTCPIHNKDMKIFVKILYLQDEPYKTLGNEGYCCASSRSWNWWNFVVCKNCFDVLVEKQLYVMGRDEYTLDDDLGICHFPRSENVESEEDAECYLDSLQHF